MPISKLIFIGPMNLGNTPTTGDTMKNQLFLDRFHEVYDQVYTIDTMYWRKSPWILLKLFWVLIIHRKAKVIISANPGSADTFIKIINKLPISNDIFYWVVGGSFHKMIEDGKFSIRVYKPLARIFVQGQSMVDALKRLGLNNSQYVANSKPINHYGEKHKKADNKMHFVFLSRIEEYKGCSDILESVSQLIQKGYKDMFDISFYGRPSEDGEYANRFKEMVAVCPVAEYKGVLNLRDAQNYDELASYDCMLFPTYWHGEGFPGIVIDAYISSLPIIASDWNLNKDVIEDGVTGWIIQAHDVKALTERMEYVINNPDEVVKMGAVCKNRAALYDSRVVLSEENLKRIGIL